MRISGKARRAIAAVALSALIAVMGLGSAGCTGTSEQDDENSSANGSSAGGAGMVASPTGETADATADDVQALMDSMTVEEKAAQLFIVTPEQLTGVGTVVQAGDATKEALDEYPVGGLIYFDQNLEDADQVKTMLENTQGYAKYGLFLSIDEEGGPLVSRIANNAGFSVEDVPSMAEIGESGDVDAAYQAGSTIGGYLADLGFNLDYAPVADVLTNPDNTAIGSRSFGSDPGVDATMVSEVVRGLQENHILSTLKHFPGHGDTEGDSHEEAVADNRTLAELEETEFVPFEAGIEAGASCVMVGHISLPQVTGDDLPATLSQEIVTGLLRDELGFEGIVVTDSMSMGAITNYYSSGEAAVAAVNAGCDVLLTPENFQEAYQGILDALNTGALTEERLDESVQRILSCKVEHGIITMQE